MTEGSLKSHNSLHSGSPVSALCACSTQPHACFTSLCPRLRSLSQVWLSSLVSGTVSQTSKAQCFRRSRHTPVPSTSLIKCGRTKFARFGFSLVSQKLKALHFQLFCHILLPSLCSASAVALGFALLGYGFVSARQTQRLPCRYFTHLCPRFVQQVRLH